MTLAIVPGASTGEPFLPWFTRCSVKTSKTQGYPIILLGLLLLCAAFYWQVSPANHVSGSTMRHKTAYLGTWYAHHMASCVGQCLHSLRNRSDTSVSTDTDHARKELYKLGTGFVKTHSGGVMIKITTTWLQNHFLALGSAPVDKLDLQQIG